MAELTVGDIACGRSGDKATTLDLTVVAADEAAYGVLVRDLTAEVVKGTLAMPKAVRYEVPNVLALKFVLEDALDAGPLASRRAGVHWQKAAISPILGLALDGIAPRG
jgi:hypothetical protein